MKYPSICAICRHLERVEIEHDATDGDLSLRATAKKWDIHYTQLWRHMNRHFPMGRDVDPNADHTCGEYARITDADRERVAVEVAKAPIPDGSSAPRIAPEVLGGSTSALVPSEAIQPVRVTADQGGAGAANPRTEDHEKPRAIESVRALRHRIDRVMTDAEVLGNPDLILRAGREVRQTVELEARLTGEARDAETSNAPITVVVVKQFGVAGEPELQPKVIEVGTDGQYDPASS